VTLMWQFSLPLSQDGMVSIKCTEKNY
jgi:hypothetical protein